MTIFQNVFTELSGELKILLSLLMVFILGFSASAQSWRSMTWEVNLLIGSGVDRR